MGHHFACGYGEVDENLFDLAAVGLHDGQAGFDVDDQFDLFAQQAAQHFDDIIQKLADIDGASANSRRFAEGQKLVRERGGSECGFFDFPHEACQFVCFRHFIPEDL